MKKLLLCLTYMAAASAFAVNVASSPADNLSSAKPTSSAAIAAQCANAKNQVNLNRQKISQSYQTGDGCGIGNMTIQTHNLIQDNLQCFPTYVKGEYKLFHVFDIIDTSIDTLPAGCDKPRAQVTGYNQNIKQALLKNDGCTAGKVELQAAKIIQANLRCFPRAEANPNNMFKAIDKINASGVPVN